MRIMGLIQNYNKLGYKQYTEFTVEELDKLYLEDSNKQIEYYFIQKWLLKRYKIYVTVECNIHNGIDEMWWNYTIYNLNNSEIYRSDKLDTDEIALEEGLQEALELIKEK